jgi:hypothetical protein
VVKVSTKQLSTATRLAPAHNCTKKLSLIGKQSKY